MFVNHLEIFPDRRGQNMPERKGGNDTVLFVIPVTDEAPFRIPFRVTVAASCTRCHTG